METLFTQSEQNLIIAALMCYRISQDRISKENAPNNKIYKDESINAASLERKCRDIFYPNLTHSTKDLIEGAKGLLYIMNETKSGISGRENECGDYISLAESAIEKAISK